METQNLNTANILLFLIPQSNLMLLSSPQTSLHHTCKRGFMYVLLKQIDKSVSRCG